MLGDSDGIVDVTVSGRSESRAGIRVHRAQLRPDEVTSMQGMRVTTAARTLYDLASMVAPIHHGADASRVVEHRDVERALAEALVQRLTTRRAMLALLDHHHGHGAGLLRELLESDVKPALTRSDAEERFLDLVRRGDVGNTERPARLLTRFRPFMSSTPTCDTRREVHLRADEMPA
jgi:hypothetical protein